MYIFAIDNVTSENFNLLYIILCMVTFIKKYVEFYEKDMYMYHKYKQTCFKMVTITHWIPALPT